MQRYEKLSDGLTARMTEEKATGSYVRVAFDERNVVRRDNGSDIATVWRPAFVRDIDKILHCPYYNRYTDKTQVFSLYKNDDITRRSLHVQLVSRIARTIGSALNLNVDLIEAIALGHDIGHPPFGHAGENYLDALYFSHTGRHFSHSIHSLRVLDAVYPNNLSLQTLEGIVSHNGEIELSEYYPTKIESFSELDALVESCCLDDRLIKHLIPSTLEGCVVRISDIIAYLGKDRQDAVWAGLIDPDTFSHDEIGSRNPEIINNLMVNIIECSYGQPYIKLDAEHFCALRDAKRSNYELIYNNEPMRIHLKTHVRAMMEEIYEKLLSDLLAGNRQSPIFTHHISYVENSRTGWRVPYRETEPNQIVVDYIASMTDDYFIDIHSFLFPQSRHKITYKGYFD